MLTEKEKLLMYFILYQNSCIEKNKPVEIMKLDMIRKELCPKMEYDDMIEMFAEIQKEVTRYAIIVGIMDDKQTD